MPLKRSLDQVEVDATAMATTTRPPKRAKIEQICKALQRPCDRLVGLWERTYRFFERPNSSVRATVRKQKPVPPIDCGYIPGAFPVDDQDSDGDVKMSDSSSDDEATSDERGRGHLGHSLSRSSASVSPRRPDYSDRDYIATVDLELELRYTKLLDERDKRKKEDFDRSVRRFYAEKEKSAVLQRRQEAQAQREREQEERLLQKKLREAEEARKAAEAAARAAKSTVILDLPERDIEDIEELWSAQEADPRDIAHLSDTSGLSAADLRTTLPGTWLNDQIVNQVLKIVSTRVKAKKNFKRGRRGDYNPPPIHCFDTHMFTNFTHGGWSSIERWWEQGGLRGQKMLKSPLIVIPINSGAHWTLAVIDGPAKTVTYYDSLRFSGQAKLATILRMVQANLGSAFDETEWTLKAGVSNKQENSDDCGVFAVCNALAVIAGKEPEIEVRSRDMDKARMYLCWTAYYNTWYEEGNDKYPVRRYTKFDTNGTNGRATTTNVTTNGAGGSQERHRVNGAGAHKDPSKDVGNADAGVIELD